MFAPEIGQFAERRGRAYAFVGALIGMVMMVTTGMLRGDGDKETVAAQVDRLIKQLGHGSFAQREAASKELAAIGEPALDSLRQAAASNDDPEIRLRAQRVVGVILERAGQKELAKWADFWKTPAGEWMEIKGDRWSCGTPTSETFSGSIRIIEIGKAWTAADMTVEQGSTKGQTVRAIFRLDGDTLHYCGTYSAVRATEFKTVGDYCAYVFKRRKK
jgi:hypothetical protein